MFKWPGHIIPLDPKEDKNSNIYHIGRCQVPWPLSLKKGVLFKVFLSEDGREELHLNCADPESQFSSVKKTLDKDGKVNRLFLNLETKIDANGDTYYVSCVQDDNLELPFEEGLVFFVFTAQNGAEKMQIAVNDIVDKDVEIIRYESHRLPGSFAAPSQVRSKADSKSDEVLLKRRTY